MNLRLHPQQQLMNTKKSILVVDDTPDNIRLLSAILTEEGYQVRKALDGEMALLACQHLVPDLILMDVMMPQMSGYEVCQKLKDSEATCHIPVIFISALDDVLDKVKAFETGGVDYVSKPFQKEEIVARIETHLKLSQFKLELKKKNDLLELEIQERLQAEIRLEEQKRNLEKALWELKQTETQLVQAEKMAALGQLVAGIAHEINNPIGFISGNLSYLRESLTQLMQVLQAYQLECPEPSIALQQLVAPLELDFLMQDLPHSLEAMQRGADRVKQIVLSLRNFARLDESGMKPVDLQEGIESTLVMLQHRLRETTSRPAIEVIRHYQPLPKVNCYAGQINQVLMNLLNNAIDAIEVKIQQSDPKFALFPPQITITTTSTAAQTVKICIADNGCGIAETIQADLFNPFFTTKPVGNGMGMGLAISYQIIVQTHRGQLTYQSRTGEGTEFVLEIPCH